MQLLNKDELASIWDDYDWAEAENELNQMQVKLSSAVICGQKEMILETQKDIVQSLAARMLAVRHVSNSATSHGVDGVRWKRSHQKMQAAVELANEEYTAKPTRFIVVQPKRGKERNVKLSTMFDRAMQTLHSYTIMPIAETLGDRKSFAFRLCRSAMDAHVHIQRMFEGENTPKYVVLADVQACYESISHKWLKSNIPMDKSVLGEFLGAGYVFDGELFPADDTGLSIGSGLSPLLANMVLDGLQKAIYKGLYGYGAIEYERGNMVRFADDVVITAGSKEEGRRIVRIISRFLRVRGLTLSPTKTKVIPVTDGFNFLSRKYIQVNGMMYSSPSDAAVAKFEEELTEFINGFKGSQQGLIEELNRKLVGWAGYHKFADANDTFRYIDATVKALLMELCASKHKRISQEELINRYFFRDSDGEYVYAMTHKRDVRVVRLAKIPLVVHKPVSLNRNPFTEPQYFKELAEEREINNVTGKYRAVWIRQDGKCFFCGASILPDQIKTIVAKSALRPCAGENMAYVHNRCANNDIELYRTCDYFSSSTDVLRLLDKLAANEVHSDNDYKFVKLKEYLWRQSRPTVTLKFNEVEKIIGFKLSAHCESVQWWRRRWFGGISEAGHEVGYAFHRVDLKKRTVTFKRDEVAAATVKIPDVFLKGKIPADAATELTSFFEYLRTKYGF